MGSDSLEPDPNELFSVAQRSHLTWSAYLEKAHGQDGIAESCFRVEDIIGRTPAFPHNWLEYVRKDQVRKFPNGSSELYLSGRGYWQDIKSSCQLKSKALDMSLLVGTQEPCRFDLVEGGRFQEWPDNAQYSCPIRGNYLAILTLAWAYIFSAKWTELSANHDTETQFARRRIEYLISESKDFEVSDLELEIGQADCDALDWWRAIVSPGQGWRSTVTFNGIEYQSPWSVFVSGIPRIKVRGLRATLKNLNQKQAPHFETALGFLINFCKMYDLQDQCLAALCVAILIPAIAGRVNQLPLPKFYPQKQHIREVKEVLWEEAARIPYYMSIGCNTRGVMAILCAPFFDTSVACNFVSAWLDPIFRILDPLLRQNEYRSFLNMISLRESSLAPLWLGAIIIGFERFTMQSARLGTPIVDLVAGAWTGVDLSFITAHPIQNRTSDSVQRADECRLLFFLNCLEYERPPICPWRPFGSIPLQQAAVEAQAHSSCGHVFEYRGWSWDFSMSSNSLDTGYRGVQSHERRARNRFFSFFLDVLDPVWTIGWLKLQVSKCTFNSVSSNIASKTATRSIFGWLRSDGWPLDERHIWNHVWFIEGTDEESDIESGDFRCRSREAILQWRLEVEQRETNK